MKTLAPLVFAALLAVALPHVAAAAAPADQPQTMNVWPADAPGETGVNLEEKWDHNKPDQKPFTRVTNVTKPTLSIFRPDKAKDTGVAVIVCPGGGYTALMMDYEGEDVAKWLNTVGVTGIVLKYRVREAVQGQRPNNKPALQDAQRALGLVRSRAADWGIDPNRIGILGFSAGGHLACAASTNYDKRTYDPIDAADKVSCRPDFAVVIYPGGVLKRGTDTLADEIRVTKDTPPAFIVMAHDDRVNSENAVFYYLGLKRAGVPAELHVYASGGHGFGIRPSDQPHASWPQRCLEWMTSRSILKSPPKPDASAARTPSIEVAPKPGRSASAGPDPAAASEEFPGRAPAPPHSASITPYFFALPPLRVQFLATQKESGADEQPAPLPRFLNDHLSPTTIPVGPSSGSTHVSRNPASAIHP